MVLYVYSMLNTTKGELKTLKEIEEINVAFNWEEYEEYLKSQK